MSQNNYTRALKSNYLWTASIINSNCAKTCSNCAFRGLYLYLLVICCKKIMKTAEQLNALGGSIIGAAIEVHKVLGPGLLESIYQEALQIELKNRGHDVQAEVPFP
jgi:hypothetical protein